LIAVDVDGTVGVPPGRAALTGGRADRRAGVDVACCRGAARILFDFAAFVADGQGWVLVDPATDSPDGRRSGQRVAALLAGVTSHP
jgi:hypothetical protein